ncbi:MAG: CPBP family intramembrane metalloprotease [Oligosphaeraceae bacterium]|nr:CPBP family intramembrane metalloprotease [Oligosphaeraceae bacterium]
MLARLREKIQQLLSRFPEGPDCPCEPSFPAALLAALFGIIILSTLLRLVDSSALPAWLQLLLGQLPFTLGGLGGAWLCLRQPLREFGWRGVLCWSPLPPAEREQFWRRNLRLTAILIPGSIGISLLTAALLQYAGWEYFPEQSIETLSKNARWPFWPLAFVCSAVIAPVAEEILFRHLMFRSLRLTRIPAAALLTACVFSLLHALPQAMPAFIFVGLMLQLACRIGSLRQAMLLHASYNLIMFWLLILRNIVTAD